LIAVPLVPILAALACAMAAQASGERAAFDELRVQVRADMAMLREASAS